MKKLLLIPVLLLIALAGCSLGETVDYGLDFDPASTLTNINPDPHGEPWIAGGAVMPSDEEIAALPQADFGASADPGSLPVFVDNTANKEFRPIFSQYGGSCAQASGVGYIYTYEINAIRDLDASLPQNQYASGYTWNAVNGGRNSGSWMSDGWNVIQNNGIPNVVVYGGNRNGGQQYSDYSKYMSGYDMYYAGMTNGLENQFTISTSTETGFTTMKQWMYDHGRGQFPGGVLSFACNITGAKFATLDAGSSQSGQQVLYKMGTSGGHAMTIAGYDDNVSYDFNGDGQITTDVDINGDGLVNMKDSEKGAVLVVNSWGSYWQNSGKVWMMYKVLADSSSDGGIWSYRLYGINVKDNPKPELTAKVKIKHNGRAGLRITVGLATDVNASYPTETKSFQRLLQGSGYSNMISWTDTSAIELGLDITELAEGVDMTQPVKFFLQVYEYDYNGRYNGTIEEFVVLDYTGSGVKEYYSSSFDEAIANYTTTIITAINEEGPVSVYDQVYFRGTPNNWDTNAMTLISNFTWSINTTFSGNVDDRFKFDVNGDWAVNFGDNEPDGVADQTGADIAVTEGASEYQILFNDRTKVYEVIKVQGVPAPVNLRYELQNTNLVMLSWDAVDGADGYVISREPANGYAAFATSQNENIYAGRCEIGESYVYTVRAYTGVPYPQKYSQPVTIAVNNSGTWAKVYDQVYFRGTTGDWDPIEMSLVADNTWEFVTSFENTPNQRFKFDIYADWSLNFGDNEPDNTADQSGADIAVDPGSFVTIRFNDLTKAYSVTPKTGNIEATPSGGSAPDSELLGVDVQLIKDGNVIATKPFVLDGATYISVYFPGMAWGEYSLKVDTVKNGYRYYGTGTVAVNTDNTVYVYLPVNKQAANVKTIHYYAPYWDYSYFHYQKDDGSWTAVPGEAMACHADNWCDITVTDENDIIFCFSDGNGNWDSKNGQNYSATATEVWVKDGIVYTSNPDA